MTYADRVEETTTVTGTGPATLSGATAGRRAVSAAYGVGDRVPYCIESQTPGEWEVGSGTLTDSTHLARTTVLSSSNGGSLVDFSAGTKNVFVMPPAAEMNKLASVDAASFSTTIPLTSPGVVYMPQQSAASVLAFTIAAGAVQGALAYVRLIADGTNAPTFSGMKEWGGSMGYDNRNGIANEVQFFYDGNDYWYSISQAVGATAIDNTAPTASSAAVANSTPTIVNVTMSESMDAGFVPSASTLTVGGHTVSSVAISGSSINLTCSAAFVFGEAARTLGYTANGTNDLRDLAGNLLANFSGLSITNNVGAVATGVTMTGPTTGPVSTASSNFTVGVTPVGSAITGTVTVTPSDGGGGGTFTPTSVGLTTGSPTATFTYTPSATAGARTISVTNNGSLTNPSNITYTSTASASFMLDGVATSPVAAYSFRRLRTAYTGPLISVYSSSTTTYTDIGYDSNGDLDQSALNAAATAGGALKLAKIYDQSGNARHASNATPGNFWSFATSGGVATALGGHPSWNPQAYAPAAFTATASINVASCAAVVGLTTQVAGAGIVGAGGGNSTDPIYLPNSTAGSIAGRYNNAAATTLKVNGATASSMPTSGPTALYSDAAAKSITSIILSTDSGSTGGYNGFISEVVLFATALSSGEQTTVYNSQKTYFGTP